MDEKGFRKSLVILSVFYVIAGIILIFWPDMSMALFCSALGVGMLIVGITHVIIYFTKDHMMNIMQMDLVVGVVCGAFGAFLLLHPEFVETVMPFAVGILLLIGGIVKLQNSIDMKRLRFAHWKVVLVFALLLMILGGLLIYNPFEGRVLLIYIGCSLILDGLVSIVCMLCIAHRMKRIAREPKTVEAEEVRDADPKSTVDMPPARGESRELEKRSR